MDCSCKQVRHGAWRRLSIQLQQGLSMWIAAAASRRDTTGHGARSVSLQLQEGLSTGIAAAVSRRTAAHGAATAAPRGMAQT